MSAYQATVASFVPAAIRELVLARPDLLERPGAERLPAGVLFADISGFTALTSQLSQRGPEGAEELTRILNRYFGSIIDHVEEAGGDVLKFAGDALLALWPTSAVLPDLASAVHCITDVSLTLQNALHDFEVAPGIRLSMKLAIGAGQVEVEHLGGVFDRWEFLVSGAPLAQLGRANDAAAAGHIVLSTEAAALLSPAYRSTPIAPGVQRLLERAPREAPGAACVMRSTLSSAQTEQLLTFLPAAIRGRVAAGYADWLSELRQISVVFMNLPGFGVDTPMATAQQAMRAMQVALYRYEGSINKMSVDDKGVSLIAVLGLPPLSHTDDAERAVRAALDMQRSLAELGLSSSVGVCTGRAFCGVVGNDRRREYTVMGDVVNLSARLMQAARGGVLCDRATHGGAAARLRFERLEPIRVKGRADAIEVFVPLGEAVAAAATRDAAAVQGRVAERARLAAAVQALTDAGTAPRARLCISAEGGLGKWTLVSEMLDAARARGAQVLLVAGDPLDRLTPYRAWRDALCATLGVDGEAGAAAADPAEVLARLPSTAARTHAGLLRDALPVPLAEDDDSQGLTGEARREQTLALLAELVHAHVARGPTIIAVKNAQFLDDPSWALIDRVGDRVRDALLVVTLRGGTEQPGEAAATWLARPDTEHIHLEGLDDTALVGLAAQRLGVARVAPALANLLIERCAGNPLYCEELIAALEGSGDILRDADMALLRDASGAALQRFPASLHGLIAARVDRLPAEAQMTLKVASVVGETFAVEVVAHVHPRSPAPRELAAHMRQLADLDLVARVPLGSNAEFGRAPFYAFKNALVRDVAYGLMLFAQRRSLHQRLALWVEAALPDELPPHYATLGRHWAIAAEGHTPDPTALARAAGYLQRAAQRAARGFANREAIGLFREALALVAQQADSAERDQRELELLLQLGTPLIVTRSYADPEVTSVYDRARALGERGGAHDALFGAVRGLWQSAVGRSDYAQATRLAEELLALAAHLDDPGARLEAYRAVGNSAFWPGELHRAREAMEQAVALADVQPEAPLPEGFGQDPDIANRGILAWALATLGWPRRALAQVHGALQRGDALQHPFSMAYAQGAAMWTHFILRDAPAALRAAGSCATLSEEHGFPYFLVAARVVRGWALSAMPDRPADAADLDAAVAEWRDASGGIGMAIFLYAQAEAQALNGRSDAALATLADTLLEERLRVERWYLADVIRLRGECQWHQGQQQRARASLREARRVATEQNARLPALRIAIFEARRLGGPRHQAALQAAFEALPERHAQGSIETARALLADAPR